jgi:hypothetical protein
MVNADNPDPHPILERPKLLESFGLFEWSRSPPAEPKQKIATIDVESGMARIGGEQ